MNQNLKYFLFFVLTFITTTISGVEWIDARSALDYKNLFIADFWLTGLQFSVPFLLILTCHEFGHYFTAKYYRAQVTLPFYIPIWFFGLMPSIGTMGAFIRIKSQLRSTKEFFDIGVAGPLAGFVVALLVLTYGFLMLPSQEYIFTIHPEYLEYGENYAQFVYDKEGIFYVGDNLLFKFYRWIFSYKAELIPNNYELFHYPYLFAGYLACFFTALNLIPIGQLDGGHVFYGLFGHKKFNFISPYIYVAFMAYAGIGIVSPFLPNDSLVWVLALYIIFLNMCLKSAFPVLIERMIWIMGIITFQYGLLMLFPSVEGYNGWLLFGFIIGRFLGISHPRAEHEHELSTSRKILGWIAIVVFILCFSPQPFITAE